MSLWSDSGEEREHSMPQWTVNEWGRQKRLGNPRPKHGRHDRCAKKIARTQDGDMSDHNLTSEIKVWNL